MMMEPAVQSTMRISSLWPTVMLPFVRFHRCDVSVDPRRKVICRQRNGPVDIIRWQRDAFSRPQTDCVSNALWKTTNNQRLRVQRNPARYRQIKRSNTLIVTATGLSDNGRKTAISTLNVDYRISQPTPRRDGTWFPS